MKFRQTIKFLIYIALFGALISSQTAFASYPADPDADLEWEYNTDNTVSDIENRFNAARTSENTQLGTSVPMMTLPSQTAWDSMTDGEKAFWLINRERIDRSVTPLHGIETNVTDVAQAYAQYLLDNNVFSHFADGKDPWIRLNDNPTINSCHDYLGVAENLAAFGGSVQGQWTLPIERSVYNCMYDDSGSAWGHRHTILYYPYNDNSGPAGKEGFLGIGRAIGTFQGYPNSNVIVMNFFDPCSSWIYPAEPIPGDLNGDDALDLKDAVLAIMVMADTTISGDIVLDNEADEDGKIGLSDAIYILQMVAGVRSE